MNPNLPPGNTPGFFGTKISKPGINVNSAGDNELVLKDDYSTRTYYDSDGNPVLELGKLPNGGWGLYFPDQNGVGIAQFGQFADGTTALKVAKPGVEVSTASNTQLIFNSQQDMFKIVASANGVIPSSASTTSTLTIAHGLGYIPIVQAYGIINNFWNPFPIIGTNTSLALVSLYTCYSDATNVYFNVQVPTGSTVSSPTNIKYYLLQESAS